MSLSAQPSVVSGGFSCWAASGWTMWAPCWRALRIVSAARRRSIAGGRTMGTSSPFWKGRTRGTALGMPASTSRTSQGTSLPCKSGAAPGRLPCPPAAPSPSPAPPPRAGAALRSPPSALQARSGSEMLRAAYAGGWPCPGWSMVMCAAPGADPRQGGCGGGAARPRSHPLRLVSRVPIGFFPPLNSNSLATLK